MSAAYCAAARAALKGQLVGSRRTCWPILAGVDRSKSKPPVWGVYSSAYAEQLDRDINRALHRVQDDDARTLMRVRLSRLLNALFVAHPTWHYFQGFHDLVGILLLVFHQEAPATASPAQIDEEVFYLAEQICETYWSGHLLTGDLSEARAMLSFLTVVIRRLDSRLAAFLAEAAPEPIFALPWLLTWYAYNLENLADAALCFDLFLATHPVAALYLAAQMISTQSDVIRQLDKDYAAVHGALSRLPTHLAPQLPHLIARTVHMLARHPPPSLLSFSLFPLASPVLRYPFAHHAPVVFPQPSFFVQQRWSIIAISSILVVFVAWAALRYSPRAFFSSFLLFPSSSSSSSSP